MLREANNSLLQLCIPKPAMSSDAAIVAGVRAQWEQGLLLDFIIEVEGRSFKVNKSIMSAVSDYFHAMVNAAMDESEKHSVKLEAVSLLAMEHLINFIYKGHMDLTKANVTDILDGAVYLQMKSAITACTDFILENLDATLCYEVLSVFQNYSLQDGISKIRAYIKANMKSITTECDLSVVSYDECCFLISNWQEHELALFFFLRKWIKADFEKRMNHAIDLTSRIRFCLMTEENLRNIERKYIGIHRCPWYCKLERAFDYHGLPMHLKVLENGEQTRVRGEPMLTLFCAEYDPPRCYILDAEKDWKRRPCLTIPEHSYIPAALLEVNNFLIVIYNCGTYQGMLIFDPRTTTWAELAPMKVQKESFAVVHHASCIYVLGGTSDAHTGLDTVVRYDFQTDTWSSFTTLPSTRLHHAACTYEDFFYVSGGVHELGGDPLKNVDCLNLSTMEWQSKAPMLEAQCQHKMFTMELNGQEVVCVLGSRFQLEYYDLSSDQWFRFDFSLEYTLPKGSLGGVVIPKGNTLYYIDDHTKGAWNNGGVCFKLEFPAKGNEVTVKPIKHFSPKPPAGKSRIGMCGAVIALPLYKYCKQRRV